jgi:hypothetical protein
MQNQYVIENENNSTLLWSNVYGWVDCDYFDVFTFEEKEIFTLPIEGRWMQLITY